MNNALIGYSGFVGSTLLKQTKFSELFRSNNIHEIENKEFELVICAGAPAQKWLANKDPHTDRLKIDTLINHLQTIKCKTFVLISTVDVFKSPIDVNENTFVNEEGLNPYGLHRRILEKFVIDHFPNHLIVRLPGLVGPGLRKNIIFDFLNQNNVSTIESRSVFQFYPMVNLWSDIQLALRANLSLVHLTAEPISVANISFMGFGIPFNNNLTHSPVIYNLQTVYSNTFGSNIQDYQYSARETLLAIRAYAQSETVILQNNTGVKQ